MPATLNYKPIGMAAVAIAGLPAAWNVVARNEYRRHTMARWLGGKTRAAYALAAAIFFASFFRDSAFHSAMVANPSDTALPILPEWLLALVSGSSSSSSNAEAHHAAAVKALKALGYALVAGGTTLVVSSFLRLGVTGTYLGDYCGIKMKERVTSFPFSHFENPMYLGATLNFLGAAFTLNNGVGAGLTAWVAAVYYVSTTYFENPFTAMIYAQDDDDDNGNAPETEGKKKKK